MGKGLPRSMSRGNPQSQEIIKQTFVVRDGTLTVASVGVAIGFGSLVIGDFPEGNILFLGAIGYFQFAGSGVDANLTDNWEGDFGVGTTPADDATITGTDIDLVASTVLAAATAEVGVRTRGFNVTQAMFDNTDNSLEINLNALIDAASIIDNTSVSLTVNGELHIAYIVLGDD